MLGRAVDESPGARWLRRSITIPLILGLTAAGTALLPFVVAPLVAFDLLFRDRRLGLARTAVFFVLYLWCETLGLLALLWAFLTVSRATAAGRERWLALNYRLEALWGAGAYKSCELAFGFRTVVEGDLPKPGSGPLVVLIRHASTADTMLPLVLMALPMGWRPRYVLKRELLIDPCVDCSLQRLPNRFVRRGGERTETEARRVAELLEGLGPSDMLIIYPEGTRFTPARRARTLEQLRARGPSPALELAESLQHTLPPLRRGTLALLAENPGAHLLIVGHSGFEGTGSFAELTRGELVGKEVRVRSWLVPFDAIPRDEEGRIALLSDYWKRIDAFVDEGRARHEAPAVAPAAAE